MTKALVYLVLAAAGAVFAGVITIVQNRYVPGDPENGARLLHIWLIGALWVLAWTAAAYDVLTRKRR
jgi:hypothetical protein